MKVLAAILTYRPHATGRLTMLADTFDSLTAEADAVWVVDNGSGPDEVAAITDTLGVQPFTHDGPIHTCGHGTNLQARVLAGAARFDDICVLSDDDMAWRPGWRDALVRWWNRAPSAYILAGCHLEPEFAWNAITGTINGALVRESTGAASWTYRAQSHAHIFPIPEKLQGTGDVPACQRLRAVDWRIAQLDLADHVGTESTWGNRTVEMFGWNVKPVRARLAVNA